MPAQSNEEALRIVLQRRVPSAFQKGAYSIVDDIQYWNPKESAIVICDMWDRHWCKGATARVDDMSLTMNEVLTVARNKGVLIIHAPSGCIDFYKNLSGWKMAKNLNRIKTKEFIGSILLPSEVGAEWPLDQSDGGCDCSAKCRVAGVMTHQNDNLKIMDNDLITDSGAEIEVVFTKKNIKNVILMGVHTNMCIMERTFGLRSMVRMGMNVALMRDMTDLMYNHEMAPKVDHFTGLSLMIEYIEKYVCPTVLSCDFTKKKQFRFKDDKRPILAFITTENEYGSNQRFPEFGHELMLVRNINCEYAIGKPCAEGNGVYDIENLHLIKDADQVVTCIRNRALEPAKMKMIRDYLNSGKQLLAIHRPGHSFDTQGNVFSSGGGVVRPYVKVSELLSQCPESDKEVLGGNFQGHFGLMQKGTKITIDPGMENHLLLKGVAPEGFVSPFWIYINRPLSSENIQVLPLGSIPGQTAQPISLIDNREKGKVIYTSLGNWYDWKIESFCNFMFNSVDILLNRNLN